MLKLIFRERINGRLFLREGEVSNKIENESLSLQCIEDQRISLFKNVCEIKLWTLFGMLSIYEHMRN